MIEPALALLDSSLRWRISCQSCLCPTPTFGVSHGNPVQHEHLACTLADDRLLAAAAQRSARSTRPAACSSALHARWMAGTRWAFVHRKTSAPRRTRTPSPRCITHQRRGMAWRKRGALGHRQQGGYCWSYARRMRRARPAGGDRTTTACAGNLNSPETLPVTSTHSIWRTQLQGCALLLLDLARAWHQAVRAQ